MYKNKVILFGLAFILFFSIFSQTSLAWWDSGWDYKKTITITENSGSTLTDYQVPINVTYDSGMQSDFDDLRFIDSDDTTELSYWIGDKVDSSWAYVWVKVPSIPASSTATVYMYYGNDGASSESKMWDNVEHLGIYGGVFDYNVSKMQQYSESCGAFHTCVLRSNGNVDCYGKNDYNQSEDYTGGDAIGVAAGEYHTCVLKSNGNVDCYGRNDYGQAEDYTEGDAIGVAVGEWHTCVLKSNGNVDCYGRNNYNQANDYNSGDAIGVAAGWYHTCVLRSNGNVDCYGNNDYNQANDYNSGDAIGVAAGEWHTCVLKSNGNVDCYGRNDYGQAEDYTGGDAISVSVGGYHTCVLKSNGNVDCYGKNSLNQAENYTEGDAIGVAVGEYHTCVLKSNGNVDCYGLGNQAEDYTEGDAKNPFRKYTSPEPTYSINQPPQYSDIMVSPSSPQTYGIDEIWFNITWTDTDSVDKAWIVHNFSGSETTYQMINDYGDHYYYKLDFVPPAGNYTYTFYANDTLGVTTQTSSFDYEIQKATTTFHVAIDGSETDMSYTYPTTTNVTAWTDDTGFDGVTLYRNGTPVSNPEVAEFGAGVYNYTGTFSHQNYTATSVTRWLTINKAPSGLSLTSSNGWTIFSGDSTTITCTADSPLTTTLKVNDVIVSSPYTFNPTVGVYDVNCVVDDQENYTPSSTDKTLLVNPVSSCLDTYVYYKDYSSSASITTLNFTELVNNGYVKPDLSDVEVNVTDAWINTTDGYYFIVNNTGNPFRVQFTNYAKNNTYSTHELSSTVFDVSGYTQQSQSITYNILDEQAGTYMLPPNATLIAYIECPLGENFMDVDTTNFTLASKQYISKAALRVKYTADSYYSRQFYPDEFNDLNLNFYVTDAYENALDRIDFVMVDVNYYDTLLQIYKEREESKMIVTEGYFDSSHMFSAYLLEDTDYYLRVKNADGSYTEFGRISVVVPATKTLGKTTINLNPQAVLIADNLYMNAFMSEDRKTMYIEYNDKLNETDNITITTYFENGTVFKNETYTGVNSLNLEYDTTGYENESFTVSFSICHETFGNSPVTYSMSLFAPYGFGLGLADYLYQLISLGVLMFVGGLATRRSLIAGILLFSVSLLVFYGIGWLSIPPVFIAFVVVLFALAIIIHLKSGGEE